MKQGWEIKRIKDICYKESSNIAQNKIVKLDGGYPVYGASGFIQNVDFYQRDTSYIGVVKDGSGVGRVNIYPAFSSLLGTLQYILPKDGFHINYVAYALKSLNLAKYASGAAIPHIYFKDYGEETIPVPPLPVQEQIVSELDLLSGIIEKKREQLKELDALAQSIFYDMFGDPITNEKGWEVKKLGEVCESELGKTLDSKRNTGELYPYLCTINIQWGYCDLGVIKELRMEREELERYSVKKGDLLICEGGDTGRSAIWNKEESIYYQNSLHRVRFKNGMMLPIFCQYLMWTLKNMGEINKYSKGQTIQHLVKSALLSIKAILPPLPLQHQFASKIEAIERQKELIKQSISETETLFNARMQEHFG